MSIFYSIGNKWYDNWTRNFISFSMELSSPAAKILTPKEREEYSKIVDKLYKLNNKVKKRIDKENKKK